MSRARVPWPAITLGSTAAAALAAAAGGSSPLRTLLVVWFLLTCPGMALARLIDVEGAVEEASVGIGISLAWNLLAALALVYVGLWSAGAVFAVAAAVAVVAAVAALRVRHRRPA